MICKGLMLMVVVMLVGMVVMVDMVDKKIVLFNNYVGNSWCQVMLESWKCVIDKVVVDGVVVSVDVFIIVENQVIEQVVQIQNMILQGYDVIVINVVLFMVLNGVVKEVCDVGIIVVSFDGIVIEFCVWCVVVDFKVMGKGEIDYLVDCLFEGGNLLEICGFVGVLVDDEIYVGIQEGVVVYLNFKVVGLVNGDWVQDVV